MARRRNKKERDFTHFLTHKFTLLITSLEGNQSPPPQCGCHIRIAQKEEVVVAGGGKHWNPGAGIVGNLDTATEIYSVEDREWREGTPFPLALAYPASLQYEDTFLVMGGSYDFCSNKIYKVRDHSHKQIPSF